MKFIMSLFVLILFGCATNTVYIKDMNDISKRFPGHDKDGDVEVRKVTNSNSENFGYFEIKYKAPKN